MKTAAEELGLAKGTSFLRDVADVVPRLILNVHGPQKCGKTRFLLQTCPQPLAFLSTDLSEEGHLQSALQRGRLIVPGRYVWRKPELRGDEAVALARKVWADWQQDYIAALRSPRIRCIGIDAGDSVYKMCRVALLGRLSKVPPFKYEAVNLAMQRVIQAGLNSDKTIVWVNREKEQYRNDKGTGRMISAGYAEIGYEAHATVRLYQEGGDYCAEVVDSRFNGKAAGTVFTGRDVTFKKIARVIRGTEAV